MADVLSEAAEKLMLVPDPDVHLECSGLSFLGLSQSSGLRVTIPAGAYAHVWHLWGFAEFHS